MGKNIILIILGLTLIWLILIGSFSILSLCLGLGFSIVSIYICRRLLPSSETIKDVNLFKIALYPFYLIFAVYLSAFNAMKFIFTGTNVSVIEVKTRISNGFLRTILANSITLTPGSASLELKDNTITLLWLNGKNESRNDAQKAGETIKNKLERILIKAEK